MEFEAFRKREELKGVRRELMPAVNAGRLAKKDESQYAWTVTPFLLSFAELRALSGEMSADKLSVAQGLASEAHDDEHRA